MPKHDTENDAAEIARMRNDVAEAVAEIISNDSAPERLRSAVVDYVTDAPPYPDEPAAATPAPRQCPDCDETEELFEYKGVHYCRDHKRRHRYFDDSEKAAALARRCVSDGDFEQQLALVALLDLCSQDAGHALTARQSAFAECTELFEPAIEALNEKHAHND